MTGVTTKTTYKHSEAAKMKIGRSGVANGTTLFIGGDGRTRQAKRFKDIYVGLIGQLGGQNATESAKQLARKAALLATQLELVEARASAGAEIDLGAFATATGALRRLLVDMGLTNGGNDKDNEPKSKAALDRLWS